MTTHPFHKFHIPVMGLAYSIDTSVKVAHFGINSVISIIEDNLVELMRKYHYQKNNETYRPISTSEEDYRARRITDYLNLVNRLVKDQTEKLRASAFEVGSDIAKYFEMLPEDSVLKRTYRLMTAADNPVEKENLQNFLRGKIKSGSIEVNIMTKVDRAQFNKKGEKIRLTFLFTPRYIPVGMPIIKEIHSAASTRKILPMECIPRSTRTVKK